MTSTFRKPKNSLSVESAPVPVRRFEMGATAVHFFEFLQEHGYDVHARGGEKYYSLRHGKVGRFATVTRLQIMQLVDKLRKKKGLQPFYKI